MVQKGPEPAPGRVSCPHDPSFWVTHGLFPSWFGVARMPGPSEGPGICPRAAAEG